MEPSEALREWHDFYVLIGSNQRLGKIGREIELVLSALLWPHLSLFDIIRTIAPLIRPCLRGRICQAGYFNPRRRMS
jgi:hypothetical protein